MTSLVEIYRRFPTREAATAHLEKVRWPHGPECVYCGATTTARHTEKAKADRWQCWTCEKSFSAPRPSAGAPRAGRSAGLARRQMRPIVIGQRCPLMERKMALNWTEAYPMNFSGPFPAVFVSDGTCTYAASLPDGMTLDQATDDYAETADYEGDVECTAMLYRDRPTEYLHERTGLPANAPDEETTLAIIIATNTENTR